MIASKIIIMQSKDTYIISFTKVKDKWNDIMWHSSDNKKNNPFLQATFLDED